MPLGKAGNQVNSLLRKPELKQLEQNKQGGLSRNITQQASIPVDERESCSEQVEKVSTDGHNGPTVPCEQTDR